MKTNDNILLVHITDYASISQQIRLSFHTLTGETGSSLLDSMFFCHSSDKGCEPKSRQGCYLSTHLVTTKESLEMANESSTLWEL